MPGTYYKTCPYCGAALDPGETCDCMKGEDYMSQNETQMKTLLKNIDEQTLDALTRIMEAMLKDQEAQEAQRYRDMGISPAEAVEIIEASDSLTMLDLNFCTDAMRYYRAKHLNLSPDTLALWSMAMLLEAGRIIGIRQERARLKARIA